MRDILILGGTGKTGRRLVRRLRESGHEVRTAARSSGFDLDDEKTWALEGVAAAYLLEPSLRRGRIPRLVGAAVAAGVRRLVLLSAPAAGDPRHPLHDAERAVTGSGLAWTIVRPHWFAQNFSESSWRPGILAGTLALPTGDGRTPFVDAEDIAAVAASALTDERHDGETYELTGPRALSFGEATALIGAATGRVIRHQDISAETYVRDQLGLGMPRAAAEQLARVLTGIRNGEEEAVTDGVERALGRPAGTFEDFVDLTFRRAASS